ncbi:MAG: UbiA family prenyltransferase [Candidatus Thermoplasmatota archaeon]|jgi:4-hydroxybenzoate polyprenyltransferase|nr:UbiA family prenyltransferase [Candidatus Thermoplasmatota archaeon]
MRSSFLEYARLIRLPGLGGFSIAPVFGAISLIYIGVYVDLKILILLFLIGVFKSIYGIVLNDYADIEIDKLSEDSSKRPLVKGTISKKTALIICVLCVIGVFVIVFLFFYKNQLSFYLGILCIIVAAIFGTIYNLYGKRFSFSAIISALADALFVLVGAFLVSNDINLNIFTWVVFILVFTQYFFMTAVVGGIKDADHDILMNVKNIALASGVRVYEENKLFIPIRFKAFALGIRFFDGFVVFVPFAFYRADYELWHILLLLFLVLVVLYFSVKLINIKTLERRGRTVKILGLQGVLRYSFVPIILVPVIGLFYAFLLVIFPLLWYIIFRFTVVKDYFAS